MPSVVPVSPAETPSRRISVANPVLRGNEEQYVLECVRTGWISSVGRFVPLFEQSFARFCETQYGVAACSGTTALHLALLALGVGPGDEVLVPTLTFVATANAVTYCGAKPVFVDSESGTMNLDPERIEELITPRTRGIGPVHLYGHPANMGPILEIARRHNLFVVEDAAEAHGARWEGKKVGSIGDAGVFSFYGNKIITTGEGGMVTTNDAALAEKATLLRGQGMDPQRRYWFPIVGYNYRLTNIAAAIGLAQTEQIEEHIGYHQRVAQGYKVRLRHLEEFLVLPGQEPWADRVYWAYTVVLKDSAPCSRDGLMEALASRGIETRPVFPPVHNLPPYRPLQAHCPVADRLAAQGVTLPTHGLLSEADLDYIAEAMEATLRPSA